MIDAHMAWRDANLPVKMTPMIVTELKKGKVEAYGKDIEGRPLIMVRSGKFDPKVRDLQVAVLAVLYLLEEALKQHPPTTQFIVFYDRTDFSLRARSHPTRSAVACWRALTCDDALPERARCGMADACPARRWRVARSEKLGF